MSTNRYPHFDVVVAWMNGEAIQRQNSDGSWSDGPVYNPISTEYQPAFYVDTKYRIKPKTKKYRVGLFNDLLGGTEGAFFQSYQNNADCCEAEKSPLFIRWVTDWVEVEV